MPTKAPTIGTYFMVINKKYVSEVIYERLDNLKLLAIYSMSFIIKFVFVNTINKLNIYLH